MAKCPQVGRVKPRQWALLNYGPARCGAEQVLPAAAFIKHLCKVCECWGWVLGREG